MKKLTNNWQINRHGTVDWQETCELELQQLWWQVKMLEHVI